MFGDCLFDSERRGLWHEGEPVRLSPKAFRLLEILLERRPDAVSQKELYDALWPDTFVDLANLHNLVSQVRAAIGDREHRAIRTVYGFGFSFGAVTEDVEEEPAAEISRFALVVDDAVLPLRLGTNLVGRSAAAHVRIFHPSVSRAHSRVIVTGDEVTIEDAGSRNGTFVGDRRIHEASRVTVRDTIRIGKVAVRLVSDDVETEAASRST
ncbi:MAG TPA: winged helix-turn-helix domain-containing protein [Thermoanaerobaculia bacterium]|nr:winged helix-turn-helix domain-containing protein [Thermoanaerobaculia bacterium]